MKPGYKTTEFWLAVLAQLVPLLVLVGVLAADEAQALIDTGERAVAAVAALLAAAWPIVKYIEGRAKVKAGKENMY